MVSDYKYAMAANQQMTKTLPLSDHLRERLRLMPKFELHVHIVGAADADTYINIAQKNNVDLPVTSRQAWQRYFEFRDFPHFIEVYTTAVNALRATEDYGFLIDNFFQLFRIIYNMSIWQ